MRLKAGWMRKPRLTVKCGDNGGRNRLDLPCGCRQLFRRGKPDSKGRCKFHGGMLTGPKTPEGRARADLAGTLALAAFRFDRKMRRILGSAK